MDGEDVLKMTKAEIMAAIKGYFDDQAWTQISESNKEKNKQEPENHPLSSQSENNLDKRKLSSDINVEVAIPTTSRYPPKKYPKRQSATRINYFEEEEPSDDRYIFCDNCKEDVVDYCKKCGVLLCIKDVEVPMGTQDRAMRTVPSLFEIKPSPLHGLGAFASKIVPKGLQLGPYEGRTVKIEAESGSGYSWKLKGGKLVDASDERYSNWMRYVNCARNANEQNLVAFQYKGELYYRTAKKIEKGEELLVFYGNEFGKKLGIDIQKFFDENKENEKSVKKYFHPNLEEPKKDYYLCKFCRIGLSTEEFRYSHQKRCRFGRVQVEVEETFACKYCSVHYATEKDRDYHERFCRKKPSKKEKIRNVAKIFECDQCMKKFTTKGSLEVHLLTVHNKENAPKYRCNHCQFETTQKSNLNMHLLTHDKLYGLVCRCCKKSFKRKSSLDNHYITKHREQYELWKYKTTSKLYHCSKCPYQTVYIVHFKNHTLTHEQDEDKKYKYHCAVCGYKCIWKGNFKTHLNLHTGRLAFTCIVCDKKFNRKNSLDGHILSNHSENEQMMKSITNKIHKCPKCAFKTVIITHLKYHILNSKKH